MYFLHSQRVSYSRKRRFWPADRVENGVVYLLPEFEARRKKLKILQKSRDKGVRVELN